MNWISVKDNIPEDKQAVLAVGRPHYKYEEMACSSNIEVKYIIYDEEKKEWTISDHCCDEILLNVTHWMPLPKPPQENE